MRPIVAVLPLLCSVNAMAQVVPPLQLSAATAEAHPLERHAWLWLRRRD